MNPKQRAEREARLRGELAKLAELQMQVSFLASQLRRYEILVMGAAEAIGKILAAIDGVLDQLEQKPKAVKDATFLAFLLHLKSVRIALQQQEVHLEKAATEPPTLSAAPSGGQIVQAAEEEPAEEEPAEDDAEEPSPER